MLTVYLENGSNEKFTIFDVCSPVKGEELMQKVISILGANSNNYFFKNNGCLVEPNTIIHHGDILLQPKLLGGKGGFGSMLRAIGAQIEKTTNREACRDLSGRRLRDINEEKRLKSWMEKQSKREEEAAERKKKKLEKLCAQPKHEFKDKSYEEQRSTLTERVEDAVEVGFAAASSSGLKRTAELDAKANAKKKKKKTILDLDDDIDSDDLDSSDDSADEKESNKKSNSEHSSDSTSNCPASSIEDDNSKSANDSPKSHNLPESNNGDEDSKSITDSTKSCEASSDSTSR